MPKITIVQLPAPQINFGRQTGNIPLAAACLRQSVQALTPDEVLILPESVSSYLGDAALLDLILRQRPDVLGFSTYVWNVSRVLFFAHAIKAHYEPRIVLGGPEVTPDNSLLDDACIDFRVFGEGESVFKNLLSAPGTWESHCARAPAAEWFRTSPSAYISQPLETGIENMMLVETMRGCPYSCAYCYYNKALEKPSFKEERHVLQAVAWALAHDIKELYLLDPSLNCRPGLKELLKKIAALNDGHRLSLISEIRAEAVDAELAQLLAAAGVNWLEIGLQTTNPRALKAVGRPTDLDRFLKGVSHLKANGIESAVDLIVGLPEDDLSGIRASIDFVAANDLHDDIQVFPLSVLPGTEFRRHSRRLGLVYDPTPPYTVIETPTLGPADMLQAFDYAEERFDLALYPLPDLDLGWRNSEGQGLEDLRDVTVTIDGCRYIYKAVIAPGRCRADFETLARRVTHPYQLLIPPGPSFSVQAAAALGIFTAANPHTPLEMVFFEPGEAPDIDSLLSTARLVRPHYLDNDWRLLYAESGNRALLFTVVTRKPRLRFEGPMQRRVFWWNGPDLPHRQDLEKLAARHWDGVLIDSPVEAAAYAAWQDRISRAADDQILIAFSCLKWQKRWISLTQKDDYYADVLP